MTIPLLLTRSPALRQIDGLYEQVQSLQEALDREQAGRAPTEGGGVPSGDGDAKLREKIATLEARLVASEQTASRLRDAASESETRAQTLEAEQAQLLSGSRRPRICARGSRREASVGLAAR